VNLLYTAGSFVKYRFKAENAHGIHSPFVYEFFNDVLNDPVPFYGFEMIESLRARLLLDKRKISVTDYGTGKRNRTERICDIAQRSLMQKKYAEMLFRIVNKYKPASILELGTSFGLTTLYISLPDKQNNIITLEGCPETSKIARENFKRLKRNNIELLEGEFSETLPKVLAKHSRTDLVIFDGNHQRKSTLDYFHQCLKVANENSIFVFDDIHWGKEMESAWQEIKENNAVTLTVDLFRLGIVFFKKEIVKQDFVLKY
jgi:predicted O-methyltransferase YrrM